MQPSLSTPARLPWRRRGATLALLLLLGLGAAPQAQAQTLTRPMGMGNAFRGHGSGNGALFFNPAAMSLVQTYSVEATYLNLDGDNRLLASVADTKTSALGAGVGYLYRPAGDAADDHEVRVALSTALVPGTLTLGAMGRYAWLGKPDVSGLTVDAGMAAVLGRYFSLGAVAHNLMPNGDLKAERTYGFGLAFASQFTAAFDLVLDPARDGREKLGYHGGLEFLVAQSYPIRLGYEGLPGEGGAQHLSFGFGAISQQAGLQVAFRQRLDDSDEQSIAVSLNLFR